MEELDLIKNQAAEIHGNKYEYINIEYIKGRKTLCIKCKNCNSIFYSTVYNHLKLKQNCKKCAILNRTSSLKKTTEDFINEANKKWNFKYDYSNTKYNGRLKKITYKCPEHGIIEQSAKLHLKSGCQYCNGRGISKYTKESFIKKANLVHNNFYDYSNIIFNNINDKISIECPVHGLFEQKAANHINSKNGCPKCNGGVKNTQSEFIEKASSIHNDTFDYKNLIYKNSHSKIKITCKKHGEFEQLAYMHLKTKLSCPKCVAENTSSQTEKEIINFIKQYYENKIIPNDRNILGYKEVDIYLPDIKLGIEFHGNYWHTEEFVGKNYHFNKADLANKNGITLFQIFEHEWENKKTIIKSKICNQLKINQKIPARKTTIVKLNKEITNQFLSKTHIQGKDNSSISFGLEFNNELVAVMTFGKPRFNNKYNWELIRYSSKLNTNIIGGASKLLSKFKKEYKGSIISYADRRWSNGKLYFSLGFKLDGYTSPGYFYYNINKKITASRIKFQKHKLTAMEHYDKNMSEQEVMKLNGWSRIFDAGHLRFII